MPLQILYVDDEEMLLEVAKAFLESDPGLKVDTVNNAGDALDQMLKKRYDLILSDYQMWPIDGIALLKDIRGRGDQIPFILFTGRGREEIVIEALNNGADFYIQKGGDTESLFTELRHKIKMAVQRRQQHLKIMQYDDIVHRMDSGIIVFRIEDPKDITSLKVIDANPWVMRTYAAFGVNPVGMRGLDLFPRMNVPDIVDKLSSSLMKGESVTLNQFYFPDPAGKDRYFNITAFPLPDNCFGALVSDVTNIVATNADMIENEHKFRALFSTSRVATAVLDFETQSFEDINGEWTELYGYTLEELKGRAMSDLSAEPELTKESVNNLHDQGELHVPIRYHRRKNGTVFPAEISASSFNWKGKMHVTVFVQDITERIRAEELMRKRMLELVSPGDDTSTLDFADLFDLEEIQRIQDTFAKAMGVASIITAPDGMPITEPSNFCRLCNCIRSTEKGLANCLRSDTEIGMACIGGPKVQHCLSGGLWDSGTSIVVGGKHVANWLIGQVMDEDFDLEGMMAYCREIGADEGEFRLGLEEAIRMPMAQFQQVTEFLNIFALQMSNMALQNVKQARYIMEMNHVQAALEESEWRFKEITTSSQDIITVLDPETLVVRSANECIKTVLGVDPLDLQGRHFKDFIRFEDEKRIVQLLNVISKDPGKVVNIETKVFDPKGIMHIMELHALVRRNLHGELDMLARIKDITARRAIEEKLKQSELLYRSLVNSSPDGIVISDLQGSIMFMSPGAKRMFALPPEYDGIGDNIMRVVEPESVKMVEDNIRALISGGEVHNVPYRLRRLDGGMIWGEIRATVFYDESGRPTSIMSILRDVTEKIQAEEEIEESRRRLALALETAGEGFFVYDMATGKATYSDELLKITGYSKEEMGDGFSFWLDHIHPDENKGWSEIMADFGDSEEAVQTEYRLRLKDGTWRWYDSQAKAIKAPDGSISRIIGVVKDIHERKMAQEALAASERHYRELVENASEAITIIQDGRFLLVNRMGLELTGYSREELLALSPFAIVHPEDVQKTLANHQRMLNGQPREPYTIRLRNKTGQTFWCTVNGVLIDWNGRPAVLNFYQDVTETKRNEEAIRMANRKLNLLSSITRHDILNQLTMLMGYMEMERSGKGFREANFLKMKHAARNIERQISFSKDYESMGVRSPEWQNVAEVFARAEQQFYLEGIEVGSDVEGWEIFADPLLEKVFYNLIDNSIRYAQHLKKINLVVNDERAYLKIIYSDDGVGISPEDRERLFEKGFGKNTGYGLFLAKEILSLTDIGMDEVGDENGARFQMLVPPGNFRRKA
ncbi:MAG: putative diguanylate cyclase [Methanomassiliicoccales archaeon PtaU1.Bin124]|nr:MAG: putative diguanylate cyclase [Methanomassiliicoccales archaeon PtaU1.Bin124]